MKHLAPAPHPDPANRLIEAMQDISFLCSEFNCQMHQWQSSLIQD